MLRTLTVTTPATDLQLLTIEQLREAAGITGTGQDAKLSAMGLRVAADICSECDIAIGIGAAPTLRRETLTEDLRAYRGETIVLARRHDIVIDSIIEDGVTLDSADYHVDPESGLLSRLVGDHPTWWVGGRLTAVYAAGFQTVPGDLADAATDFMRLKWREKERDPSVKGYEKDIPGLMRERTDYWAGSLPGQGGEGAVPDVVAGQLARYRNPTHG